MERKVERKVLDDYNDVLTIEDLMEFFHIGMNTAYGLLRDGSIRSYKIGRGYRIPKQCVREFLERMERGNLNDKEKEGEQ